MQFIHHNKYNSAKRIISDKPHINFIVKTGVIYFNNAAEQILDLKKGTRIEFLQSESDPREWYLAKGTPEGFELKQRHAGGVMISSRAIVQLLARSLNLIDRVNIKIPLAKEMDPVANAYALITSAIQ